MIDVCWHGPNQMRGGWPQERMMDLKNIRNGHLWDRYVVLRVLLAIGSLIAMVMASGAGSYWS
jgi:hypothetical protein